MVLSQVRPKWLLLSEAAWEPCAHPGTSAKAPGALPTQIPSRSWLPTRCHRMLVPKCSEDFGGCRGMVSHGDVPWPLNKQLNSVVLKKSGKNKAQSYSHVAKNRSGMWCLPAMHSRSCKGTSWHFGTKGKLLFIAKLT